VCYYAEKPYKLHHVCVPCRVAFKRNPGPGGHRCPRCSEPMVCDGHDFAGPRRRDTKAWTVVAAALDAGLRYEGREPCGCGKEPKFRPVLGPRGEHAESQQTNRDFSHRRAGTRGSTGTRMI
jgi:hypothetical protein